MTNHEKATEAVEHLKGYIRQYEEGLITLHEMANAVAHKALGVRETLRDQGCDGLSPNNILPSGERDDGMVFVG